MDTAGATSGNWQSFSYGDLTLESEMYKISEANGNFPITPYITPFLYVINFPTKSYSQRICTVGKKCMIYGYIQPTTLSGEIMINRMTFLLPKEFNYSNQATFDRCRIQATTTNFSTFNCQLVRNNSQITITYIPPSYNHRYNLINMDHSSASQLFTAPNFPGNHYQMQVNLWSAANALVESQYINLTTV